MWCGAICDRSRPPYTASVFQFRDLHIWGGHSGSLLIPVGWLVGWVSLLRLDCKERKGKGKKKSRNKSTQATNNVGQGKAGKGWGRFRQRRVFGPWSGPQQPQQQYQMALASRLTLAGDPAEDPEDFFGASLAMFDDVINLRRWNFLLVPSTSSGSSGAYFHCICPAMRLLHFQPIPTG